MLLAGLKAYRNIWHLQTRPTATYVAVISAGGGTARRDGGIVKILSNNPSVSFADRANCQASATPKNASKGESHPKHFLGLKLIDKTIFCKVSLSKEWKL